MAQQLHSYRLKEALQKAARESVELADPQGGSNKYISSTTTFVRRFKEEWILSTEGITPNSLEALNGPIFFLFWKNVSVTNLSLNELIALIRIHARHTDASQSGMVGPIFASDEEYTTFLHNIWDSLIEGSVGDEQAVREHAITACEHIITHYADIVCRTIVFDAYFTSVLLNVPRSISIDLTQVVANSGYIHSAGLGLYIRNTDKATEPALIGNIKSFLRRCEEEKFFLVPYAEEFFNRFEKAHSASSLRNGLDGVRFHFRKHTIGKATLQQFLAELPNNTENRIVVPRGLKPYWKERQESLQIEGMSKTSTIWLISDHNVHETDMRGYYSKGTTQYFIVYAQLLINDNQLTLFKERKPGWVAPVTLPHTLSAALANVAYERWLSNGGTRTPVILDPFCGTGTTLIDMARRFGDAVVIGLDRNPLASTLCKDNLQFFSQDKDAIENFQSTRCGVEEKTPYKKDAFMRSMKKYVEGDSVDMDRGALTGSSSPQQILEFLCKAIISELSLKKIADPYFSVQVQRIIDDGFSDRFVAFLSSLEMKERWMCLLIWRGFVYGRFSVNDIDDLYSVIEAELLRFARESEQYLRMLNQDQQNRFGNFVLKDSAFSLGVSTGRDFFAAAAESFESPTAAELVENIRGGVIRKGIYISETEDSASEIEHFAGLVDIIITDPPYGFNTEHDHLRELYGTFFLAALGALRPKGQLIVSLPDFARNGKHIPFYQTRGVVIQQVIAAAQKTSRRIVVYGGSVPHGTTLYHPPFYWTSTSGVSRSILHFTLD